MALAMLLRYIFQVTTSWLLPPNEYGLLGIIIAILSIAGLILGIAFPWVVTKAVSEGSGSTAFRSSLLGNVTIGIIFCVIFYVTFFSGTIKLANEYDYLLYCIMLMCILAAIANIYEGALKGLLKFKQIGYVRVLDQAIILGGVPLIAIGFGVSGAIYSYLAAFAISTVLFWYYCHGHNFLSSGKWIDANTHKYAWPMFIGGASGYLLINIDIIGLKLFSTNNADTLAGYYQAIIVLSRLPLGFILGAVLEAYFPFISKNVKEKKKVSTYSGKVMKYSLLFSLPITLPLVLLPKNVLGIFFPEQYLEGATALSILSIGTFFLIFIFVITRTFQAISKPKIPALVLSICLVAQIALLYTLVPKYNLIGAATSTTISSFFGFVLLSLAHIRMNSIVFKLKDIAKLIAPSILLLAILVILPAHNNTLFITDIIIASIIFLASLLIFKTIDKQDIEMLLGGILSENNKLRIRAVNLAALFSRSK